eukprot:8806839-Lingulodinium_polyedra.AAC.1
MKSSTAVTLFLQGAKPQPQAQRDPATKGVGTTATVVAKGSLFHEVYSALGLQLADGKLPKTFWHSVVEVAPRGLDAAGP